MARRRDRSAGNVTNRLFNQTLQICPTQATRRRSGFDWSGLHEWQSFRSGFLLANVARHSFAQLDFPCRTRQIARFGPEKKTGGGGVVPSHELEI